MMTGCGDFYVGLSGSEPAATGWYPDAGAQTTMYIP